MYKHALDGEAALSESAKESEADNDRKKSGPMR